jgi:hypothetical protein
MVASLTVRTHPFGLAVRRWVIEFCQAMIDTELRTGEVKRVGAKALARYEQLTDFSPTLQLPCGAV